MAWAFKKFPFSTSDFISVSNEIKNKLDTFSQVPYKLEASKQHSLKRLTNNTWVQHTKGNWCLIQVSEKLELSAKVEVVTRDLVFNDVSKSIKLHLDKYPEDIQAIVLNALTFSNEAKVSWGKLERLNPVDTDELALLALMDYRFLAALLYNCSVERYTVGVKEKLDGYTYSSAPVYDGTNYHRIRGTPDILKALINFQSKKLTKPLEFFVHAPTHNH